MFNPKKNNRGQILIPATIVLLLVIILGFGALAVDIGYFYNVKNELQVAADAAALAGAVALQIDEATARTEAVQYALANFAMGTAVRVSDGGVGANTLSALSDNPGNDITVGFWDTSTGIYSAVATSTTITAVQVRARRTVGSPGGGVGRLFVSIVNSVATDITATAIATAATSSLTKVRLVQ